MHISHEASVAYTAHTNCVIITDKLWTLSYTHSKCEMF